MPPKAQPKIYQLLLKTHKLTIFITTEPATRIASLKAEALSALSSEVNQVEDVPKVMNERDFEISRAVKDKGKKTVQYEVLEGSQTVKDTLTNWEVLFFQFRDQSGNLLPVKVTQPSLLDDDDEEPPRSRLVTEPSPVNKGKRKAPEE